jgi:hypothetical protein
MSKELNLLSRTQMSGHFTMTVHGGRRGTMVLAEFDNLITDAGLNDIFANSGGTGCNRCQLGTGAAAPATSDTALQIAGPATTTVQRAWSTSPTYTAGPPDYSSDYVTMRFAAGSVTGTWSEVGMSRNTGAFVLFSRALIVNGGGSPTPITVLADESLDVTYTVRMYPATADVTGNVDISGTNYSYTLRPASVNGPAWGPNRVAATASAYAGRTQANTGNITVYDGGIGARTGVPSGSSTANTVDYTAAAYSNNSMQRTFEMKFGLTTHNLAGGIKSILFYPQNAGGNIGLEHQIEFTPKIPKDNTKILRLNFTASFARRP